MSKVTPRKMTEDDMRVVILNYRDEVDKLREQLGVALEALQDYSCSVCSVYSVNIAGIAIAWPIFLAMAIFSGFLKAWKK